MKTPISLNDSIAKSIHDWPTLYACRTDVLHQYFCVNGNGMEWKNGVLVDGYGSSTKAERDLMIENEDEKVAELHERSSVAGLSGDNLVKVSWEIATEEARIRVDVRRRNMETTFRVKNAKLLALIPWKDDDKHPACDVNHCAPKTIYPLCQYACMNEVPDDIQPDWLAGVREMIFWVFCSKPDADQPAQQAANIAFADGVLRTLHTRFGSPEGMPIGRSPSTC